MPQLNIDCEGPITQNDNAYELCEEFIPNGGLFFARVSKYDDYLADVEKRKGYKAGDTLKLILPFLKAHGASNRIMEEFSEKTLALLPGAKEMLQRAAKVMPTYIISTSYRPYLEALCNVTGFPMNNVYCTHVDMDKYHLDAEEKKALLSLTNEIASQALLDWPEEAVSAEDLTSANLAILKRLDEIFFEIIPALNIGRLYKEINPVGGAEKARSVADSIKKTGLSIDQCIYVGDSITDVQAFELVSEGGGLAISFNGNSYAIGAADWACISPDAAIISALARLAQIKDMNALDTLMKDYGDDSVKGRKLLTGLKEMGVEDVYIKPLETTAHEDYPLILKLNNKNRGNIIKASEVMRSKVRGQAIGALG